MTGEKITALISLSAAAGVSAGLAFDFWRASRKEVCWEFRKMSIYFAVCSLISISGLICYIWFYE